MMCKSVSKVSIVLPAYNAGKTIKETIDSILSQTYTNWELIIINDGSSDNTVDVIYSFHDDRILLYENETNKGLIYSLNKGISLSKGCYIARIDADDVALPERLEKQVEIMDRQPEVIVCGSYMQAFGEGVNPYLIDFYTDNESIKENFLIKPPFGHPSVMIRKSVLIDNNVFYDPEYLHAEDLKLWYDLMEYGNYLNIPSVLMKYRISSTQCTQNSNVVMIKNSQLCRRLLIKKRMNNEIWRVFEDKGISIKVIRACNKSLRDRVLIMTLYQSMKNFDFKVFLYYIISGDIFRDSNLNRKNTIRRFWGRSIPLL